MQENERFFSLSLGDDLVAIYWRVSVTGSWLLGMTWSLSFAVDNKLCSENLFFRRGETRSGVTAATDISLGVCVLSKTSDVSVGSFCGEGWVLSPVKDLDRVSGPALAERP